MWSWRSAFVTNGSRPNSIACDGSRGRRSCSTTRFELGSVLTVHTVADALTRGGDVLLMDADVLYDERIASALAAGGGPVNRVLIDRDFEAGDEPVKLCVQRRCARRTAQAAGGGPAVRHDRRVGGIFPLR